MPETVKVEAKANGFIVVGIFEAPDKPNKEIVVEGREPKRIGLAVLAMFAKPRTPRKKVAAKETI